MMSKNNAHVANPKISFLTTSNLVDWSYQIADGMDYLSSKKVSCRIPLHPSLRLTLFILYTVLNIFQGGPCGFGYEKCSFI